MADRSPGGSGDGLQQFSDFRQSHPYRHLVVDGVGWEYIASGQGSEAVLFLGGAMSEGETSFMLIRRYEGQFRVLSPSYPGIEDAGKVVDGLASLLDAEGIETTHVYGHSLGSAMAHLFVREYPKRVGKLILSDFGLFTRAHEAAAKAFLRLPDRIITGYYRLEVPRLTEGIADEAERNLVRDYFRKLQARGDSDVLLRSQLRLLTDFFERGEEYGILNPVSMQGRVLILVARDDKGFSQAEQDRLVATYPGARVRVFESGGHLVAFVQPEEYLEELDSFLGVDPSGLNR